MCENISVLITEEEIAKRIDEMAAQINEDYKGKSLQVIGILKGSVYFVCELTKRLNVPVTLDFMVVSSYGSGTESSGKVVIKKDTDFSIEDKDVLIIEDIIDSGFTMHKLIPMLMERNPASIKLASFLNKPSRREVPVNIDYCGYDIEDKFVVGFGLDYAQKYRNLPYVGVYEGEPEEDK